jgi:hypothetical protein
MRRRAPRPSGRQKTPQPDLRDGRPEKPPEIDPGLECERCGEMTTKIKCLYGKVDGYWLCPACVGVHKTVAEWSRILNRTQE